MEIYNNTLIGTPSYDVSTYSNFPADNPDTSFWTSSNYGENYIAQDNLVVAPGVEPSTIFENYAAQNFVPKAGTAAVDPATTTGITQWVTTDGSTNVPPNFALYQDTPNQRFAYYEVTGQGVVIAGINSFYLGTTPDSGAYDRGMAYWTPGVNGVADTTPPTVSATSVNGGAAQRSMVTKLSVTFSEPVVLSAGVFTLLNRAGNIVPAITVNAVNTSGDQLTWDITFTVGGIAGASLPDGAYRLLTTAADVHDLAGNAMSADYRQRFWRLFGDSNGDRQVDRTDLIAFRQALASGTYISYFDFDGSGTLALADYAQLRRRLVRPLL
jgi:hypothetical protein